MKRTFTLLLLLLFIRLQTSAQYADLGAGVLKNSVWWFNWNGFVISDGASRTFSTTDGLNVTITFSNVTGPVPFPAVMNTWGGAVLHFLYDFTDPNIRPAFYSPNTTQASTFTITVSATRNGQPAPFTLLAADAEASLNTEVTTLTTNGGPWRSLEFFRNSPQITNPLTGCGTQTVTITDTYYRNNTGTAIPLGQNPLMATDAPLSGNIQMDVRLDKFGVSGASGIAFGIFAPVDRGDLPPSYGAAQHRWVYTAANSCNYSAPFPSISQATDIKLGALPGDADPTGNSDDNVIGQDEDAVTAFPDYAGNGSYTVDVPVTNTTGAFVYLSAWFDFNRNGTFDANENVNVDVPPNTTLYRLSWTGLPAKFTPGAVRDFGFRFRISSDVTSILNPNTVAPDGEVEDYLVHLRAPCDVITLPSATVDMCTGQSVQLHATPGLLIYDWTPAGAGLSAEYIADPIASPTTNTTYTVYGEADNGCYGTATVDVNVNPLPVLTKSADANICEGTPVPLQAASSVNGTTFSWSPAAGLDNAAIANPTATPQNTTTYTVTATAPGGCSAQDQVQITVRPKRNFEVKPAFNGICKGESLTLEASGGDVYEWLAPDGTPLGTDPELDVTPDHTTIYTVNITDNNCGNSATFQVPVNVSEPGGAVTKSNDINCSNGSATLLATGGMQYQWQPAPGITDLNIPNPVVTPRQTTSYYVTITNGSCHKDDTVTVHVDLSAGISTYPIPTAFTPNKDGKNDCFGLKYWGPVISLEFNIYNRWGERVFSTNNPTDCWDGTYKGALQPVGSFVYWIKAKTLCGEVERKGAVALVL